MNNNSQLKSVSVETGMQFFPLCIIYGRKNVFPPSCWKTFLSLLPILMLFLSPSSFLAEFASILNRDETCKRKYLKRKCLFRVYSLPGCVCVTHCPSSCVRLSTHAARASVERNPTLIVSIFQFYSSYLFIYLFLVGRDRKINMWICRWREIDLDPETGRYR